MHSPGECFYLLQGPAAENAHVSSLADYVLNVIRTGRIVIRPGEIVISKVGIAGAQFCFLACPAYISVGLTQDGTGVNLTGRT